MRRNVMPIRRHPETAKRSGSLHEGLGAAAAIDSHQLAIHRPRSTGRVDERSILRQREFGRAAGRIAHHARNDRHRRPCHLEPLDVERSRVQRAGPVVDDVAARAVPCVHAAA